MKRLTAKLVLGVVLGLFLAMCLVFARATTKSPQPPSHAVVENNDYYMVLRGNIIEARVLGTPESMMTNIRVQPWGKPLLFDQSVLLCGFQGEALNGLHNPVELKVDAVSHRMFEGVGCHELIGVKHWTPPAGVWQ